MSLSQIRDAALASAFPSRQMQDEWLNRAVGENRRYLDVALKHCLQALRLCPVQGEGYIYLADLAFLQGPQSLTTEKLVAQALLVRPGKGIVQFAAGKEAALAGDFPGSLQYWKLAFHRDPEVQVSIIELLAKQLPASLFLDQFRPDTAGLARLFQFYRREQLQDEAALVGQSYALFLSREVATAPTTEAAAACWREAGSIHDFLGDLPRALDCQRRAVDLLPNDFDNRRLYGEMLLRAGRWDEATTSFQWCLRRQPDRPPQPAVARGDQPGRLTARLQPPAASQR